VLFRSAKANTDNF